MARTQKYKKIEKSFASKVHAAFLSFFHMIENAVLHVFKFLDNKLTIMIVPHSQEKVINFQTNVFSLGLGIILIFGIISSFFYFDRRAAGTSAEISKLTSKNRETQASLDELRDENTNLLQAAKRFQTSLSQSLSLLGISESGQVSQASVSGSDLSSLFNTKESVTGSLKETVDVKELTSYLENAVQPVEQIGKMLENQNSLFTEIPSIWPISNPNAHISMAFGPSVHPITGQWYIHKGLDFSTYRSGDPIIATANGQVVTVGYDASFGNYVIIKHKHGIYTRYAHMMYSIVSKGQFVSQREVIGYVGNTGITTGPHLHYEVHIGSDVVDPAKYINVKLSD
ncbi:MAG: M23 family metallopeptidase [Treponema sp.]